LDTVPIDSYRGLVELIRQRIDELGISYETVDIIAGFSPRYTSKLLCNPPIRGLTVYSLFSFLGAIALAPTFQPDDAQLERLRRHSQWRLRQCKGPQYRPHAPEHRAAATLAISS
jgi:hypothetical protein